MKNQKKSNRVMLKALFVASVATLSINAFATPKTAREEIENKEEVTKNEGVVYAVCLPSSQIVRFTNYPNEEGIRFTFPKKHVFIDGKPITDKQIQNPDLMKGCTYNLVQVGAGIGVDIKNEKYAKKLEKAESKSKQ